MPPGMPTYPAAPGFSTALSAAAANAPEKLANALVNAGIKASVGAGMEMLVG